MSTFLEDLRYALSNLHERRFSKGDDISKQHKIGRIVFRIRCHHGLPGFAKQFFIYPTIRKSEQQDFVKSQIRCGKVRDSRTQGDCHRDGDVGLQWTDPPKPTRGRRSRGLRGL